jgi:rSAM/selenodomain-associated transferase 2
VHLSVVVPTLNEEARLARLLERLRWMPVHEVIVSDGGSEDATVDVARGAGATVVSGPRGRGPQLNTGAAAASGEVLWFLHADAVPPDNGVAAIRRAMADPTVVGGAFRLWTVPDRGTVVAPLLRVADVRSRYTRHPYGDQGIFVRRAAFSTVGGFPSVPIFEDLGFSRALRRCGRTVTLPQQMQVSGRRFEEAAAYHFVLMNVFPTLWRLGVSEARLARWYDDIR